MPEDQDCDTKSLEYYKYFMKNNIEVILDDRICSIGKKLSDNELIGTPFQIIIGKRDLKNNLVEFKNRQNNKIQKIASNDVISFINSKLKK